MAREHAPDAATHLADVAFFEGFTPEQLRRVAELAEEVEAEAGAELIGQGKPGQEAYVIVEGKAGIYVGGVQKNELGPGEIVGEMALIDHRPRTADVKALTPLKLLAFDAERFRRLLDEMPQASVRVMERLVERLRQLNLQ
jgi:CRP/FNR family cyclic AMP-dependent transcriptional regulator